MSWDAHYSAQTVGGPLLHVQSWNCTHNVNRMVHAALPMLEVSWWKHLNGMDGRQSQEFLAAILNAFAADPDTYRAMNPESGWGNFDGFCEGVLAAMLAACTTYPVGQWECSG